MATQREYLAVHTGYKFYHNGYEYHTNHVLQLITELYFELESFRELWADNELVDIFVEDILKNMESIQRKFEGDIRSRTPAIGVVGPPAGGQKGKGKATHHPGGSEDTNCYDASTSSVVLNDEQSSLRPHSQNQRQRRSPSPLKLDLRRILPKGPNKPLMIRLPPTKRPGSSEGTTRASNLPPLNTTSALSTDVRSETAVDKRPPKQMVPLPAGPREETLHNKASTSETEKRWVHQQFGREYTTRGTITADTPRHETSPKHSPILPSRYHLRTRQKVLRPEPQTRRRNDIPKRQTRKLKREGAFIQPDLPSVEAGNSANGTKMELQDAVTPHTALMNGKGKRRWNDVPQETKGEGSRSQKRSRKY